MRIGFTELLEDLHFIYRSTTLVVIHSKRTAASQTGNCLTLRHLSTAFHPYISPPYLSSIRLIQGSPTVPTFTAPTAPGPSGTASPP